MTGKEKKNEGSENQKGSLQDHGVIYLSGSIDQGAAESICREIIEINLAGKIDRIQMIINSPGGSAYDGFAIIDIMEWSAVPICTTGIGMIASMGLLIFMAGEKGRRVITSRTSILSHRFFGVTAGNHSQLLARRKEEDLLHQRIMDHYLEHSDVKDPKIMEERLLRDVDTWLTPDEAVALGIADQVEKRTRRSAPMAVR